MGYTNGEEYKGHIIEIRGEYLRLQAQNESDNSHPPLDGEPGYSTPIETVNKTAVIISYKARK